MLIVTHKMAFTRDVSIRVVRLEKGTVCIQGAPQDLFKGGLDERFDRIVSYGSRQG